MAGDVSAGILAGTIELDDQFTSKVDRLIESVSNIENRLNGMSDKGSAGFLKMTTSFFTAEAAMAAFRKTVEFTESALEGLVTGSEIADVESAYEHLTAGANLTYDALARLHEGTHGQIDDLELLKFENHDLAAGMVLTADQMDLMTNAAFALANATGGEVKDSLDKVNDAMLTGRVRAVQLVTGKIDLTKAEDEFAKKVGLTSAQLNDAGKVEAARTAILEKMSGITGRLGEQTDGLDERVQQVKVNYANFIGDLEKMISKSPLIGEAFDAVAEAITGVANDHQQALLKALAKGVDDLILTVVSYAETGVGAAKIVTIAWYETQNVYTHVIEGIQAITYGAEQGLLSVMKIANLLPGSLGAFDTNIKAITADTDRLYNSMAFGEKAVEDNRKKSEAWGVTIDGLRDNVGKLHDRLAAVAKAHEDTATAAEKNAAAHDNHAAATTKAGAATDYARHSLEMERAELDAAAATWVKYDELKVSQGGSTLAVQRRQINDWMNDQLSKLDLTTKGWVEHYKAIEALGKAQLEAVGVDFEKLQKGSRAAARDAYDEAEATFQYAMQHAEGLSADFRYKLRQDRDDALANLRAYGSASTDQLKKIEDKADDVAEHVWNITRSAQTLLRELSEAEFQALGGQAKLDQLEAAYQQLPGRREGGSGSTGLNANDWAGYLAMLEERKVYQQLINAAKMFGGDHGQGALGGSPPTASDVFINGAPPPSIGAWGSSGSGAGGYQGGVQQNHFYIDGAKNPKEVADEVLAILGRRAGMSRQFSSPGR